MAGVRDHRLDNIKGILIVLVVYSHAISVMFGSAAVIDTLLWSLINSFHMAGFLLVSGFLSRGRVEKKQYDKAFVKILIPYFFAQLGLYILFSVTGTLDKFWMADSGGLMEWLRPSGALWYLGALFTYIVVTAIIVGKKNPNRLLIALIVSVLLALAVGFVPTFYYFRLTKMICYYPFFLLGYIASRNDTYNKCAKARFSKVLGLGMAIVGLGLISVVFFTLHETVNMNRLFLMEERGSYLQVWGKDPAFWVKGPALRLWIMTLAVVISLGLLLLSPKKKTIFAYLGRHSMYVYVLHWFVLRGFAVILVKEHPSIIDKAVSFLTADYRDIWLLFPLVIIGCFLLASKPVRFVFRPFLQPDIDLKEVLGRILDKGDKKENA